MRQFFYIIVRFNAQLFYLQNDAEICKAMKLMWERMKVSTLEWNFNFQIQDDVLI